MTQAGTSPMAPMSRETQECVDACMACHGVCEQTMSSCMELGGTEQMQVMRAVMDCGEMTRMCADMMMRRSPLAGEMAAMCARACDMSAEACTSVPGDAQLMRCAESCRRAAAACRAMAGARA